MNWIVVFLTYLVGNIDEFHRLVWLFNDGCDGSIFCHAVLVVVAVPLVVVLRQVVSYLHTVDVYNDTVRFEVARRILTASKDQ